MKKQKLLAILFAVILALSSFAMAGCGGDKKSSSSSKTEEETKSYQSDKFIKISWPDGKLAKMLPTPEITIGKIVEDTDDYFEIYVGNTTKEQYDDYVIKCQEVGFNRSHDSGTDSYDNSLYYFADNADNYHLNIHYHEKDDLKEVYWPYQKTMKISIERPEKETEPETEPTTEMPTTQPTTKKAESKTESKAENKTESKSDSGVVTPSFKEAMDSYEAFFDEYIEFMKKYKDDPTNLDYLTDYADYLAKYTDYMKKLNDIDEDSLSDADLAYYLEVNQRITKKLLEVN